MPPPDAPATLAEEKVALMPPLFAPIIPLALLYPICIIRAIMFMLSTVLTPTMPIIPATEEEGEG